ncbi:MAG: peptidyl-prolyl cis-trans isomerase, partial [Myxococcales bacterium]|nr:peptidyl-prolyl cis-trans isomerase [Myxococcales bacterium]
MVSKLCISRRARSAALALLGLAGAQAMSPHTASADDAASQDDARRSAVIAAGKGVQITVGDVEDDVAKQPPALRARFRDPAVLQDHVQEMLRFQLLAEAARERGHAKAPEVVRSFKQHAVQAMVRKLFDEKITPASIPEEDVRAYYESHQGEFHRNGLMRASHILLPTKAQAQELRQEILSADTGKFRTLARKHSLDRETKLRGGDLHYFDPKGIPMVLMSRYADDLTKVPARDRVDQSLVDAAFALKKVGDVSPPVKVGEHWSLVRLTGTRPAEHRELKEAEEGIRLKLWREKRKSSLEEFVADLEKKVKPETHPELLSSIQFAPPAPSPEGSGDPASPFGHGHDHEHGEGHDQDEEDHPEGD